MIQNNHQIKLSTLSNVIESNEQKRMPEQSVQSSMKPELAHNDQVYIILNFGCFYYEHPTTTSLP